MKTVEEPDIVETQDHDRLMVRFARPEIRSPLSINVLQELSRILERLETQSDIETVVFTGTGNVFASGADLREIARVTADNAVEYALRGQTLMTRISKLRQSTVAFVNGFCFGGALDLALSCKRRVATENAVFCHPGAGLGIMTGWGGTQRLPRLIGESRTLEMLFTARRVGAREALQIGLIDEIAESI